MTLTTDQITSQTFPQARRGYDPAAVDRFLARLAKEAADAGTGSMADVGRRRDEILAEAKLEAEEILRDADREVAEARHQHEMVVAELTQARLDLAALDGGQPARSGAEVDEEAAATLDAAQARADEVLTSAQAGAEEALAAAQGEAEELLAAARAEAKRLREEAEAELEQAKSGRWEDVGDRVSRILTRAESEADGLLADAQVEAETLITGAKADAQRSGDAADGYAAKVRAQAEEWSQARLAAARDDRQKAADVLEAARSEAQRTIADAEARAADHRAEADEKVRAHVADLLAGARYDLDQINAEEAKAADALLRLTTLAQRLLDERSRTAPAELGRTESFVPHPSDDLDELDEVEATDADEDAPAGHHPGDVEVG